MNKTYKFKTKLSNKLNYFLAFMPQPTGGAGANPYLPYPASGGNNFPPYPTSNFGNFPGYPGASGSTGPASAGGYPPYMPKTDGYPPSGGGYNSFFNVSLKLSQQTKD